MDTAREIHEDMAQDYTIPQRWDSYTREEHERWSLLYDRQVKMLPGRACQEFMDGLKALDLNTGGIPDFERLSEALTKLTGWSVVAVPHLVPDDIFFDHLANRRFPAGRFIRSADQLDYLQEPDVFHDVFGHVPMLAHPVFADYMQAYGAGGQKSLSFDCLNLLARLYWYTVEFGLIKSPEGMRIFGSGIVSSFSESSFCLESPSPNRIEFNLKRVMSTNYRIDDFQQTYFVINDFESLLKETYEDFTQIYRELAGVKAFEPEDIAETDVVLTRGTQEYARAKAKEAS